MRQNSFPAYLEEQEVLLTLPAWLVTWLNDRADVSDVLVEHALRETYRIAPPFCAVSPSPHSLQR